MKTLGIIGGTGPESTIEYYRRLIALYRERNAEGRAPPVIVKQHRQQKADRFFHRQRAGAGGRFPRARD